MPTLAPTSRPSGLFSMEAVSIPGIKPSVSRLVLGTDKSGPDSVIHALNDAYFERGGTAFDTAHAYGEANEKRLGKWIRHRGIRREIVLIAKGAHTPLCTPAFVNSQLRESLDRLQTDYADLYFLHRDNPQVPVGEFVDVLNEHQRAGRIGAFGGSNWNLARLQEADAYAARRGLQRFSCLSNNFSLARMAEPMWPGCLSSNDPAFRAWLVETATPLFAWSSQAYGFFLDHGHDQKEPPVAVLRAWHSPANFARRQRAAQLAAEKDVGLNQLALAYVLRQPFPTFALIGPRSSAELLAVLPALSVDLTSEELHRLDGPEPEPAPIAMLPPMPAPAASPVPSPAAPLRETCWPDARESLLLQAGLWEKSRARLAWIRFCASIPDIEALDDACYRLFPLVAANLQGCDHDLPHRDRLRGVLRHAWARNQRLLGQILPLLRALSDDNIEFLVLKGAALAPLYRRQGAVRSMADIDILIRPHDLPRVAALFEKLNSTPAFVLTLDRLAELIRFRHELTFRVDAAGTDLDVHWYLMSDARDLAAEDGFWRDAVPCMLPGLSARTLHPADQLLHTCLHGAQWNEVSPVRWLADATYLIRDGVDWLRLENQARRLRRLQPVRDTLLCLERLDIDLPSGLADHWRQLEITPLETLEAGYQTARPNSRERTRQLAWVYLRLTRHLPLMEVLRRLPPYMGQLHHFRSYIRRLKFLGYFAYLLCNRRRARL